jgi:Polycystin cation channel
VWNYLDLVPTLLILLQIYLDVFGITYNESQTLEVITRSVANLLIWLKLLYFLRIFESTGYLIRIIIQVGIDMRHFIFLLFLTIVAFGQAFEEVSKNMGEDAITGRAGGIGYTYSMILGGFDVADFETYVPVYFWVLFIAATVFIMIIMLNLLIAIISESFSNINSVSKEANFRERAKIISENMYLVPYCIRKYRSEKNSYLLMAIDTEMELMAKEDSIEHRLKVLKKRLKEEMRTSYQKLKLRMKKYHDEMKKILQPTGLMAGTQKGGSVSNYPLY